jgi:putative glycosyltransferase
MKLSIVTTMYYSSLYLKEFYSRIQKAAENITNDYEVIFVNDGSPDNSLKIAQSLLERDNKIKILDLSRNFGHHKAIMTGLNYAKGDLIFLIDCDLEEKPELLNDFYQQLIATKDCDLIYGIQKQRRGLSINNLGGAFFYLIYNFLSDNKIPRNFMTIRLMTKRYVDSLLQFQDKEPLFAGLCSLAGFMQISIEIERHNRKISSYTFAKRFSVFANAVLSFSNKPLIYIFYAGGFIFILSANLIIYLLFKKIIFNVSVEGWASLMLSLWLLGGLIMSSMGIIGLYLAKIFNEVKDRPITVIKKIYV